MSQHGLWRTVAWTLGGWSATFGVLAALWQIASSKRMASTRALGSRLARRPVLVLLLTILAYAAAFIVSLWLQLILGRPPVTLGQSYWAVWILHNFGTLAFLGLFVWLARRREGSHRGAPAPKIS